MVMSTLRRTPDADPATTDGADLDAEATAVVRRAPFSGNPNVGARGQRTQQRILDAALQVFDEDGYHQCRIDRITKRAGCSRASFYQYFSSKEDLFHQLTGRVARELSASTAALGPITADEAGWIEVREWVHRYGEIFRRNEPVFHAFNAAQESDTTVATGSRRWAERDQARIRARITGASVPPRQVDAVLSLLNETTTRAQHIGGLLRSAVPGEYSYERVEDALADLVHRSLFGRDDTVNVHPRAPHPPRALRFDPLMGDAFARAGGSNNLSTAGKRTLTALMEAGRQVFAELGYHQTRVDDVVEAAGVSHGVFYRYFENKDQLARILTAGAVTTISVVFAEIPVDTPERPVTPKPVLKRWLRRYNTAQTSDAVMARVWSDAALQDATLRANLASAFDWGRRKLVSFLEPRAFGDIDVEAMVMVGFLSSFGARTRSATEVDAAALIIQQGFLGY
jgi:AcrR family transcriptional regulator